MSAKTFLMRVLRPDRYFRLTFDFGAGEGTRVFYFKTPDSNRLRVASQEEDDEALTALVRDLAYAKHTAVPSASPIAKDDWDWLVSVEETAPTFRLGWSMSEGAAKSFLLSRRSKFGVGEVVSRGTLNPEDLIPRFLEVIRNFSPQVCAAVVDDEAERYLRNELPPADARDFEDVYLNEVLWPTLHKFCPPLTYFGAHPGNSSEIGCWPYERHEYEALADEGKIVFVPAESAAALDNGDWPDFGTARYLVRELDNNSYAVYDASHTEIWEGSL